MKSFILLGLLLTSETVFANEANVIDVKTRCFDECTFYVTVMHQDNGWNHHVNKWQVMTLEGEVIATRKLLHPHNNEQPFTRSLSHIKIPTGIKQVQVRAFDSLHGYGGKEFIVDVDK